MFPNTCNLKYFFFIEFIGVTLVNEIICYIGFKSVPLYNTSSVSHMQLLKYDGTFFLTLGRSISYNTFL